MGGGILQLAATGISDLYLTGDPQITWFKIVYRRYTEFGMEDQIIKIDNYFQFGDTNLVKIRLDADKLNRIAFVADIPTPIIKMKDPTVASIKSVTSKYGIDVTFNPPKKDTDTITYTDLFNDDQTSVGSQMTDIAKTLNPRYDARTDVLDYVTKEYSISDDRYVGDHFALKIQGIDLNSFNDKTSNTVVDPQGYFIITHEKSHNMLKMLTDPLIDPLTWFTDLNETSFVYYIDNVNNINDNDNVVNLTPTARAVNYTTPIQSPITPTRYRTIDQLVNLYPRILTGFTPISSVESIADMGLDLDHERYHLIISVDYLRKVRERNLYIRNLTLENFANVVQPKSTEQINNTNLNIVMNRQLLFNNFSYAQMLDNTDYETGLYKFDIPDTILEEDYPSALDQLLDTMRIPMTLGYIDFEVKGDRRFNRYNINENAIYDPTWEFSDLTEVTSTLKLDPTIEDIDNLVGNQGLTKTPEDESGCWMLRIDLFSKNPDNNPVIDDVDKTSDLNAKIKFNPKYVHRNMDRLGFIPHTIIRKWDDSIMKKITTLDTNTNEAIEEIVKVNNINDGFSTLVTIFEDIFSIPSIINSVALDSLIKAYGGNITVQNIGDLYYFLMAIYRDSLNYSNQSRNYRINNISLYNSIDIKKQMHNILIKNIIYVDYKKLANNYSTSFNEVYRRTVTSRTGSVTESYVFNDAYNYDSPISPTPDAMVSNRNLVYDYSKYLLWSFYLENIYAVYDFSLNNIGDVQPAIDTLSYMLLHLPVIPVNINPNDPLGIGTTDLTTQNIRFAIKNITDVEQCIIYDDDNLVENYVKYQKAIMGENSNRNKFDREYIYSGERYSDPSTINYPYSDGSRTCINREVEFFHVISSFQHDTIYSNITVYDYFLELISSTYVDQRDYINTVSFKTTEKYLNDYFKDVDISDSVLSMNDINNDLTSLIVRAINLTLINYITIIFGVWKNSSYTDLSVEPQYIVSTRLGNNTFRTNVDYNAFYIQNYLLQLKNQAKISQTEFDLGDPMLQRIKYYVGEKVAVRPFMSFSYEYSIFMKNPDSYLIPKNVIISTNKFISNPTAFIYGANFKDTFADNIDTETQKVKSQMVDLARNNSLVLDNMSYVLWRDMNLYMTYVIENLNTDLYTNHDGTLKYYDGTAIANHISVSITYYYGQYLQYIVNTIMMNVTIDNNKPIIEDIDYVLFPELEEPLLMQKRFDTEPPQVPGSFLAHMGTDVRLNPRCPFHSYIKAYSNFAERDDASYRYLVTNRLSEFDSAGITMCPVCFRTHEFRRLFEQSVFMALLNPPNSLKTPPDTYSIVDDANITNASPNASSNNSFTKLDDSTANYTLYMYRPQPIVYDDVSRSYFHIVTEFAVYRMGAILLRYRKMIDNIASMDQSTFDAFVQALTPTPSQITPPNPFDGTTEVERYAQFVAYLNMLRTDNNIFNFDDQLLFLYSVITQTDRKPVNYQQLLGIYDVERNFPGTSEYKTYTEAVTFIGSNASLDSQVATFKLVPNFVYVEPDPTTSDTGVSFLRYQTYRGIIRLWILIERKIINSFNDFFTNTLDPRAIGVIDAESNVVINGKIIQTNPDLYYEIYDYLRNVIDDRFVNPTKTIDFYRAKQIREYLTNDTVIDDITDSSCTVCINYCRHLMIYYNMLVSRYKKMRFLFGIDNVALNSEGFFFNLSTEIVKGYMVDVLTTIQNFIITDINQQENQNINNAFYYNDTSKMYFINSQTFRRNPQDEQNATLVNDYQLFDKNNNYHLSESFTLNQYMNMLRMLGLHDLNLEKYNDDESVVDADSKLYIKNLDGGVVIVYNDSFNKYFLIDPITLSLNNFSLYVYEMNVSFEPDIGYLRNPLIKRANNFGLFNTIWAYYPTISNILYDQYYTTVTQTSIFNTSISPDYYDIDTIIDRAYTKSLVTPPVVLLRDKIRHAPINKFCHTPEMIFFEDDFHERYANTSDIINNQLQETEAYIGLFNANVFFLGEYGFTDIVNLSDRLKTDMYTNPGSADNTISNYNDLVNGIIDRVSVAFDLESEQLRSNQLLIGLTIEYTNAVQGVSGIIKDHTDFSLAMQTELETTKTQIIDNLRAPDQTQLNQMIQIVTNAFNTIKLGLTNLTSTIVSLNIGNLINAIRANVTLITSKEILTFLFKFDVLNLTAQNTTFKSTVETQLDSVISAVKFIFIPTDVDTRKFTPTDLYTMSDSKILNNFSSYHDVLLLILSNIVAFITPTDTDVQTFLAYTAGKDNFYNLTGDEVNKESINNVFVVSVKNDSRVDTFNIIVENLKLTVSSSLYPMNDLTYLPRYIDYSRPKTLEFYRYDFNKVILANDQSIIDNSTFINENYYESYYDYKQQVLAHSSTSLEGLTKIRTQKIRADNDRLKRALLKGSYDIRDITSNETKLIQPYTQSPLYILIIKILKNVPPKHAWARYLGFRMIEHVSLLIDGEQIDYMDSDLMLLLYKLINTGEHERGDNILLGNIPEMYTISSDPRPSMRLYVQIPLFFGRTYGASLNLLNMMYSDIRIKIKLRKFDDLFYIEDGGELRFPVKINSELLGNFIYLGDDERKLCATQRTENMIERFVASGPQIKSFSDLIPSVPTNYDTAYNVLRLRYHFDDPCKMLLWKVTAIYPDGHPSDKIFWDLGNYRVHTTIDPGLVVGQPTGLPTSSTTTTTTIPNTTTNTTNTTLVTSTSTTSTTITPVSQLDEKINRIKSNFQDKKNIDSILSDLNLKSIETIDGPIDPDANPIEIFDRTQIKFNSKIREQWKDNIFYQIYQPYNKHVMSLDSGEYMYSFALLPGMVFQPSGTTNLSQIEDLSFFMEIKKIIANMMKKTGLKIEVKMWECSQNLFVTMSGFGALRFYAVRY
jgi:hypothetical protein